MMAQAEKNDGHDLVGPQIEYFQNGRKKAYSVRDKDHYITSTIIYYPNGKLGCEGHFERNKGFLVDNLCDTTGVQLVQNGNGKGVFYFDLDFPDYFSRPYDAVHAISMFLINEWGQNDNLYNDNTVNLGVECGDIKNGQRDGIWYRIEKKDTIAKMKYEDSKIVKGVGYDSLKNVYGFTQPYELALLNGGYITLKDFVKSRLNLRNVRKEKVKGEILISCDVEPDGSVDHIKLLNGVGHGLDEQALEAVKETDNKWQPYKRFGVPQVFHTTFSVKI